MQHRWWVLSAVACGTFMATLDSSIVNIGLPTLTQVFNADMVKIKWVVIAYLMVITCLLLPFGRLSDQFGRKKIFQLGFAIFSLGSLFCGLAPTLMGLILSRAIQGMGAAMLMANGPAIITANFPSNERGKALGTLAMVVSVGLLAGPSVGGLLITFAGWKTIFLVNVPFGILGLYFSQKFIPSDIPAITSLAFDWAGALLQLLLLVCIIILLDPPSISMSGSETVLIPRSVLVLMIALISLIFIKVESQAQAPLFDLNLLKIRNFWAGNLAGFFNFVAYSSLVYIMPFYLEKILKRSPDQTGLYMTAIPLTILVVAPISGRISDRIGSRGLSVIGASIGALGLFAMAGLFGPGIGDHAHGPAIILGLCSMGLATGLFQSPNNNAIMGSVPTDKLGVASALLATVRNLGLATGTGTASVLFAWRESVTGNFISAMHTTFYFAGLFAMAAVLASYGKSKKMDLSS